ncbi:MAG: phosphoglycerate mutase [Halioglobus sp.]|nr:phosphoglycerate mutase [Halioglobus sp.]|tara:strand:- start:3331 stop:3834 length:504 start_codon:yes stop_codon:yes gene_type:complete
MKALHLLRHAKSAWDEPGLADRQRGLNRRGRRAAPRMGRALAQRMAAQPLHVSPARRAQLTLDGLCEGWPALARQAHRIDEALYTFAATDLWQWLARQAATARSVFILGHNPALTELVNLLCGRPLLDNLPTAGYVRLSLDIDDWRALVQGCAELEDSLFPRDLPPP